MVVGSKRRKPSEDGHSTRADFRDRLFSVFVDNINPTVDQEGMWGMLKPFGRIRDIYLSPR